MAVNTLGGISGALVVSNAGGVGNTQAHAIYTTPLTANYAWFVSIDFACDPDSEVLSPTSNPTDATAGGDASSLFARAGRATFVVGPGTTIYLLSRAHTTGSKAITLLYHAVGMNIT